MKSKPSKDKVQGEGDYEAARRYDKAAQEFAQSGRVEKAAREAKPRSAQEGADLLNAEAKGRAHKGKTPNV